MLNVARADVLKSIPFQMMDTAAAARTITNAVARNKATIVFPSYARVLWGLYRLHAALLIPIGRKMVRDFRRLRASGS